MIKSASRSVSPEFRCAQTPQPSRVMLHDVLCAEESPARGAAAFQHALLCATGFMSRSIYLPLCPACWLKKESYSSSRPLDQSPGVGCANFTKDRSDFGPCSNLMSSWMQLAGLPRIAERTLIPPRTDQTSDLHPLIASWMQLARPPRIEERRLLIKSASRSVSLEFRCLQMPQSSRVRLCDVSCAGESPARGAAAFQHSLLSKHNASS